MEQDKNEKIRGDWRTSKSMEGSTKRIKRKRQKKRERWQKKGKFRE